MKLSIIIPTLEEEKYLPILLREIKKQNFSDYEIIVADADSKDKTREIAQKFGCKIVEGGLPAKGRNEGAKVAQGDNFLFIDADNLFLPQDFLDNLLAQFEKRKLDIASFPIYPVKDKVYFQEKKAKTHKVDKLIYGLYFFWNNLTQKFSAWAFSSLLVKKKVFEKTDGGFDETIKIGEDHCFAKQAAKFGKFGFIKIKPVLISSRRFEEDGRLRTYFKYALVGLYMFFFGPLRKPIFKYHFGHNLKKRKKLLK